MYNCCLNLSNTKGLKVYKTLFGVINFCLRPTLASNYLKEIES